MKAGVPMSEPVTVREVSRERRSWRESRVRSRSARPARGRLGAGEAEVEDADAAVVADHDVGGLEVAVDQAGRVGGGEALAGLAEHGEDLGEGPALAS
jgi:hypothetical protein